MQINNNISFNGLGIKGTIKTDKVNELVVFIADRSKLIDKLEKSYRTDVFISEDMANITLKHKAYGEMKNVGMCDIPLSKFTKRNENKILTMLQSAMDKTKEDWKRMDELVQYGRFKNIK